MLWNGRDQLRIQSWWSVINFYVISKNTGEFFYKLPTLSFSIFRDQQPTQSGKLSLPPPPNPWCKSTKFYLFDFSPRQSPLRDHWTFLNKLKRNAQMISVSGSPLYYAGFVGRRTKTFLKNDCVRGTLLEVWLKNNSHSQLLLKWRLLCTTSITATIAWHQQRISAPSARS